ncbi:nicotinamide N-methyltransferase-like [Pseudophryne corroboree]|uniref:nicotinamide N-methyltransferase-like n=1 Tax=Pseudophryne corroboree TaxID=495146 RepID=UPI0030819B1F
MKSRYNLWKKQLIVFGAQLYLRGRSIQIGGDTVIDVSAGHILYPLFAVRQFFKEIIIIECNDQCIKGVRNWIDNDPGAHDWSYASKALKEIENASESYQDIEAMTRRKMKRIEKCDLAKKNPTSPVELPKADCVICFRTLDGVSPDRNAFRRNLKNLSSLLKAGGNLVLLADIGTSYLMVGDDKFFVLDYDESFLTQVLKDEGYTIKCYEKVGGESTSDLYALKKAILVVAEKQ